MNISKDSLLAAKLEKMARLAFNPAAAEGEAANALTMITHITKKNGIDFDGFKKLLGVAAPASSLKRAAAPVVMSLGKYQGMTLDEIFDRDPDYLEWFVRTVTKYKQLRDQIAAFLNTQRNRK